MVFTQQRTDAGERAVGGERPTEIVLYGGYKVRRGREKWADELFATCVRLGLAPDRKGRAHLRELSRRVGLKGPSSLIAALSGPDYPRLATLRKLEHDAGLSVLRSLLALHVLEPARLASDLTELAVHDAPVQVPPSDLERRVADVLREQPPEYRQQIQAALRDILREVLASLEDTGRAAPPST